MLAHEDELAALARRLGIASSYLDINDARVNISRETQIALMEALGFPASTPAHLRESRQRLTQDANVSPPWLVLDADVAHSLECAPDRQLIHWSITGETRSASGRSAERRIEIPALEAGYYYLQVEGEAARTLLIVAPSQCWTPPAFTSEEARGWGLTTQVYGLRSAGNLGIGDFTDIAALAKAAGRRGASFLGLSPLHALFASDRTKFSPYSPSSRLFLEPLYLDIQAIGLSPQLEALRPRIERLRAATLVDYREAWEVKRILLESLFAVHRARPLSPALAARTESLGEALQSHATFEALSEHFTSQGQNWAGVWPEDFFDPASPSVVRFRRDHSERVAFHAWLQTLCEEQLERAARGHDMEIGLYRDLAVGADRYGSEVWAKPDRYALTLSVGAPPDPLGPQGQNWGFPPFHPIALEAQDFAVFRDLVVANMRHAGAIRIDHAFQLQRLFVVPPGADAGHGGYINYPVEALLAILRIESQRHRCMVIAEDLGTGPKGFSDAIMRSGLLSYRILSFEREKDGGFTQPIDYPRAAMAAITTHDLPTFKGWRRGFDIDLRSHFGVFGEAQAESQRRDRMKDVASWQAALRMQGMGGALESDVDARNDALIYLARAPSMLLAVQVEDLLDELNQANVPGLSEGPPNWRRRMGATIEDFTLDNGALAKAGALMALEKRTPRIREARLAATAPRATYRLQFHAGFTFEQAMQILPYLRDLGISHVYASPIQKARTGSTHGYDVVDPREINPALGGRAAFDAFTEKLHELGLKLLVDIVPNHMGAALDNPFWRSVLQFGQASPFAHVFDIDYEQADGKVLLPLLGKPYSDALEADEFKLVYDKTKGFLIQYFESAFPVCPFSRRRLLKLVNFAPELGKLDAICNAVNADHEAMDALLREQFYRLAFWRLASSEINYRRFFEINNLVGVRVEDDDVFALTHSLIFELIDKGQIDGLRIDHIDGLADPQGYLEKLQRRVGPGFYIIVEKILARSEKLKDWPIAGSTGYDALNEIDGVLVDQEAAEALLSAYRQHAKSTTNYAEALAAAKSLVLERSFTAERERLAQGMFQIARYDRRWQDVSLQALRRAIKQFSVALPVYRTYVGEKGADAADDAVINQTLTRARAEVDQADLHAIDFLEGILLARINAPGLRRAIEQLTGPAMAKGLEDTLFYTHAPCLALNEVGADPSRFGFTQEAFHEASMARARDWSASLIATATHDTKRGEDARARLLAITADPEFFNRGAAQFQSFAEGPDQNDAYILLQALVGAWPFDGAQPFDDFRDRAGQFFLKAIREAKRHSSWTDPNEAYEAKALRFVDRCVEDGELRDCIVKLSSHFAWAGALNGLARTILKVTLPGVPDFYQGTEFWDFAFVDPDNRRAPDFSIASERLFPFHNITPGERLAHWRDGGVKQWLIARLLAERAAAPDLFSLGSYEPQSNAAGLSFLRRSASSALFVCVPTGTQMMKRKLLAASGDVDVRALWGDEKLTLPPGRWRNLLTGSAFVVHEALDCALAAECLPWLVLGTIDE